MKSLFLSLSSLVLTVLTLGAQTADSLDTPPPPGATVITSDELQMDQVGHTAIFTGNVVVVGTNFNMKCEEMTVYFTNGNKIDHILAKGNVVINQPGRITHCGQAEYFHDEDKFVLTDQPDILDNKNEISAPEIIIFRTDKKLVTKGRTKTTIIQGMGSPTNTVETPAEPK
jgi:lipopolysaccharide transport protein LptA